MLGTQQALKDRTKEFALRVIRLVRALPRSVDGRAIGNQLIRSGTSVAANYRAACRARSRAEFAAKIGIVVEEADETCLWIELIMESDLLPHVRCESLLAEASELVAIMIATQKTLVNSTRKNPKSEIRNSK
ncbi:MAG TPA: four helix bundle protein [Chthoniobacter sp.]|nr:four helix bundle protein [Chthoniobacter sp.]